MKELSIIIPVYNTSKFLRKCLDSVLAAVKGIEDQVEVLIINDGSTDNSLEIIQEYCEQYSTFMTLYTKENGGLSDVKNYGLQRATGEFVIFLDSDDYIDDEMYKTMLQTARKDKSDVVVCDIKLVYDNPARNQVYACATPARQDIFSQVIDMNMMPASWNKIVKRSLYDGLEFPVGQNNEDVPVTPIVLAKAKQISVVAKPFYNYYQREGSIQNSEFNEKRFIILKTAKLCVNRLVQLPKEKQEIIKGSVYVHQILSLAFYPIRRERFERRYEMLTKYMKQVDEMFPDLWENFEVKEYAHWGGPWHKLFRTVSLFCLKHKWYWCTSAFWAICNRMEMIFKKQF